MEKWFVDYFWWKIVEWGWIGDELFLIERIVNCCVAVGYVDDCSFVESCFVFLICCGYG